MRTFLTSSIFSSPSLLLPLQSRKRRFLRFLPLRLVSEGEDVGGGGTEEIFSLFQPVSEEKNEKRTKKELDLSLHFYVFLGLVFGILIFCRQKSFNS